MDKFLRKRSLILKKKNKKIALTFTYLEKKIKKIALKKGFNNWISSYVNVHLS